MAKVLFIQYFWMEKLGLMYISSMLKKFGHETLVCMNDKRQIKRKLSSFKPDIVGFQCATGMQRWVNNIAGFIKQEINKNTIITVGGPHPTFFPEVLDQENIDIICQGEGEYPMLELANSLDSKGDITGIKNLWVKIDGQIFKNPMRLLVQDLDHLPFPDRDLYRDYKYISESPYHHFITSRGCPHDCTFCYNHAFKTMQEKGTKYMRRRSVDNVIRELKECKSNYRLSSVILLDDNFSFGDKDWLFSFLDRYKMEIGIPFYCMVRANLMNEVVVKKLKDSGCYWVQMGVETGNEAHRNKMLKKDLKDSEIVNAAKLFHKYDLNFNTANMVGLPHETLEEAIQTLEFNSRLKPAVAWCSLFQPYPKTELGEYCLKNGLVDKLDGTSIDVHSHTLSPLKQCDINEIINLHKFAHIAVKFPFFIPVIKWLIRCPPNTIFLYFNRLTYTIFYWAKFYRINIGRVFQEVAIAFKYYRNI